MYILQEAAFGALSTPPERNGSPASSIVLGKDLSSPSSRAFGPSHPLRSVLSRTWPPGLHTAHGHGWALCCWCSSGRLPSTPKGSLRGSGHLRL